MKVEELTDQQKQKRSRARFALIAMAVMFAIPVVAPFFYKPSSFVNHGDLLQPHARVLDELKLLQADGMSVGVEAFKGKWTMLIFDHPQCDPACQRNLYNIRQVRLTQGRRMKRVQLAWIMLSGEQSEIDAQLLQEYPMVQRYNIGPQQSERIDDLFATQHGKPSDELQRVYFVDPFGNLVMSFAADQNPKDIQKDLGRLLRVSKVGEKQADES